MTVARHKIAASLAARGRPVLWATDAEAAVLSGMEIEKFKREVSKLEAMGFPKKNALNDKRPIPAILDFWGLRPDAAAVLPDTPEDDNRSRENWDGQPAPRRRESA